MALGPRPPAGPLDSFEKVSQRIPPAASARVRESDSGLRPRRRAALAALYYRNIIGRAQWLCRQARAHTTR
eukprot:4992389-Amphidinium_carterae.2